MKFSLLEWKDVARIILAQFCSNENCGKLLQDSISHLLFYEKIGMVSGKFHCNKQIRLLLYELRLHVNYEV
jgi:hypothetical protein